MMMKCGCDTNAVRNSDQKPVCIAHYGISPGADEVMEVLPDLTGRMAKCTYCHHLHPSDDPTGSGYKSLPFFVWQPEAEHDKWYDGCLGWN